MTTHDAPEGSDLRLSEPGEVERPPIDVAPADIRDHALACIRVTDPTGAAIGPWAPEVDDDRLLAIHRTMVLNRAFDQRVLVSQRQGKTSFGIAGVGEEAIGATTATVMDTDDMAFPTYRQAGYLIGRGYPIVDMFNQVYGNADDPLHGTRLPGMYSSREYGFFTISGGLGTQVPQAVGWAMANRLQERESVTLTFVGDGSTATSDLHAAMVFASSYRPPVIIAIVNNQYAISTSEATARGMAETFAQRGRGYGLPSLRVDGNDVLAILSATTWARDRALAGHGPTVIEYLTYRGGAHSTSDDPTRYRSAAERTNFPLGDPIERSRLHLVHRGIDPDAITALEADAATQIEQANGQAEAVGTFITHAPPSIGHAFEHVYEHLPPNLVAQRQEAGL